jgi:uncharacterized protein YhfF
MAFPRVSGARGIEFGTQGASRIKLTDLVLHGNKRATAGLLSEYHDEGEEVEHVGELLALIDNDGKHVGTLKVTRVDICEFINVPDEFALAENEGDLSAEDFRESHLAYWNRVGENVTDDTQVVQVYFELLEMPNIGKTP